jgi:transposase
VSTIDAATDARTTESRDVLGANDARSLPPDAQAELRRRVVAAVVEGMSQQRAARKFNVSRRSVGVWVRAYRRDGPEALDPHRRGRRPGEQCVLSHRQQAEILVDLSRGTPDDYGLNAPLWSRRTVAAHIERRFGLHLSDTTAAQYLSRWDLVAGPGSRRPGPPRPEVSAGAELAPAGDEHVRILWRRPVPTFLGNRLIPGPGSLRAGPVRGEIGPPKDYVDLMIAATSHGSFFACLPQPTDSSALQDVAQRTMHLLRRRLCLTICQWPPDQIELLHAWCVSASPFIQIDAPSGLGVTAQTDNDTVVMSGTTRACQMVPVRE